MTIEQFRLLRKGDTILDGNHRNAARKILNIKRIHGKRGQGYKTRVVITCTNLKSPSSPTHIFVSDEIGSARFSFNAPRCGAICVRPTVSEFVCNLDRGHAGECHE